MSLDAYSGYRANDGDSPWTTRIMKSRLSKTGGAQPDAEYFKVLTADGKTYILRYDQETNGPLRERF